MVKSVLGVNHQALREWLIQRVTALIMVVYTFGMVSFLATHSDIAYYEWHGLFNNLWVKVSTILVVLSLLYHAWIGIWTVLTDYIKCSAFRLVLDILIILSLIAFFVEALLILWGI